MDPSSDHNESQVRDEDRLSALPDDILLNILERPCLRTAVQTSTLSRRWRHLPLVLSRLVFDIDEFVRCSGTRTVDKVMASYSKASRKLLVSRKCAIKYLRLSFHLAGPSYLRSIGQAVGDAVESVETEFLEFVIWPEITTERCTEEHMILFGQRFMSFLDACPNTFRCLTSLTLRSLQFGEADFQNVLNTCEKLQALYLKSCELRKSSSAFKIDMPNSQLVAVEFIECYLPQVDLICVPLLARLVYHTWFGRNPQVRLWNVPRLHDIRIASAPLSWQLPFTLSGWLSNTRNLSNLYLDFRDEMVWFRPEGPKKLTAVFTNLKSVHLYDIFPDCDLKWTLLFLEAATSLNSFYVKISRHICGRNMHVHNADKTNVLFEASNFKHYNLNLLDIKGFEMEEKMISYIKLIMERAVALKKVHLYDKEHCIRCDRMNKQTPSPVRSMFPNNEGENKLIMKQLTNGSSSSSIEIIIE